ncbi:protoporphyrinogen oxidase HemJ [Myxacorys almedinensis]|uniref:Protoporphyrinogen IX oxidase n=1 Tax=Myxacorys almedinensis A TaxID=2690445 RepID=A0A8J7Z2U5_9CYAN|nr:protoporphyrinogen oxidase HemJ [Myxacorys almedinensis]NDJ18280.1 protoporphyrinogen oxidase HemJ [Myxacorys almedinensis A]
MAYLWFKAFHIVGIVCWFAGMFYLPRLFVYHAEAHEQPEPARSILKNQYQIMEKRLYSIIMTPAMILTLVMAGGLVSTEPEVLKQPWLQIKLACVALLLVYHHACARIMKQFAQDRCKMTGQQFRWFNEFPTVFFVVVVMLAVFKNTLPTSATAWGIFAMVIAMAAFIQLYARKRRLAKQALATETLSKSGSEVSA